MNQTAEFKTSLKEARNQQGQSLLKLSQQAPTLVIFLRHFG